MIRVNLLPIKEIKAEVSRRRDLTIGGITLGVTVFVLLGVYLYQTYRLSSLRAELAGLRGEVQTLATKVKEVGDLQNKIKEFRSKYKIIVDLNEKKVGPVRVMESLSAATPPSLWLVEFKDTGGTLVINGLAVDNQTVADFLKALAASAFFKNVELVEATQGTKETAQLKKFSIKSNISYQLPAASDETKKMDGQPKKEEKKG